MPVGVFNCILKTCIVARVTAIRLKMHNIIGIKISHAMVKIRAFDSASRGGLRNDDIRDLDKGQVAARKATQGVVSQQVGGANKQFDILITC